MGETGRFAADVEEVAISRDGHYLAYVGNEGGYFDIVIRQFGGSFTPDDTYVSSRLGALESINGGITTLHAWDHNMISYEHAQASFRALPSSSKD